MFKPLTILDVKIHIAELSKVLRNQEGISQDQFSEKLSMSRITIQNLERPKNVTMDTFLKMLQHFELLEKFDTFIAENIEHKNITPLY